MPFNVMIQLCRVTRASKLFQRNFYLPLLKPLSPKDALRRHIITGKNLLGKKIEHYMPVLEEYSARVARRRYIVKGKGKKRQRKKSSMKYVMPFFDSEMENHDYLQSLIGQKPKGRGQWYTYYVPDKDVTLVIPFQMERAIRDRDITDVIMAQRSEKIVVKTKTGKKVTLPLVAYDGKAPFYRGEGWTKRDIEEYHHHGKETMGLAKLFEAKESGVEDWELEMMRLANKRKVKQKGEGTQDWKAMMAAAADNMDWEKFEEDTKVIVEQINDPVEDEPIAMEVDDMEKTKYVNEKLRAAGMEVLKLLPVMPEIPEIINIMKDGELTEMVNVSGVMVTVPSNGKERFICGQVVKADEGDIFMPGQTVENENEEFEYTPGFTVFLDGEPTLLPGLVMGDDPNKPMFLPGESTITETGELQFTETEDDRKEKSPSPEPEPVQEEEELELEEEQNSEEEKEDEKPPPPPPPRKKQEFTYERPKRLYKTEESKKPKKKERGKKKPPPAMAPAAEEVDKKVRFADTKVEQKLYDLVLPTFEKDFILQEKERVEKLTEKKSKEEVSIDRRRREIAKKAKEIVSNKGSTKYEPLAPVRKSAKLEDLEQSIKKGEFFTVDHKKYLSRNRPCGLNNWREYQYQNTFDSVGMSRHLLWKSVY